MKYLTFIFTLSLTACSSSENVSQNIKALNGSWVGICDAILKDGNPSNEYVINTYNFNNGSYTSSFTLYSDEDCVNEASKANELFGVVTFIEDVLTVTGLTANKVHFESLTPGVINTPTSETLLYLNNNILYFGVILDDLNVIALNYPYMKTTDN